MSESPTRHHDDSNYAAIDVQAPKKLEVEKEFPEGAGSASKKRSLKTFYGSRKHRDADAEAGADAAVEGDQEHRRTYTERHAGSFPLAEIKNSVHFVTRVDIDAPKRKYALCFGYLGTAYQGLQINPNALTVEAMLERALFLSGAVRECNYGNLQKLQWSRAARTDSGVHAVQQCCSMRLSINCSDTFLRHLNSLLPSDITAHSITKVSKAFNAKDYCSKRHYEYLLPSYILADLATSMQELDRHFIAQGPKIGAGYEGGYADPNSSKFLEIDVLKSLHSTFKHFRLSSEKLETFRAALQQYLGTHSFHNFTSGKSYQDPSAKRYIIAISASDPFVDSTSDIEFIKVSLLGQSFLLNQIRKMVGLAIDVANGTVALQAMCTAFSTQKVDIPTAPGVGLYLDQLFFDIYNAKVDSMVVSNQKASVDGDKDGDNHQKLHWDTDEVLVPKTTAFKQTILWPHIYREENEKCPFMCYLDYLRVRSQNRMKAEL